MDTPEYRFLASERATLQRLIERCGADEPISRASFEYRLQQVESELAAYEKQPSPLADARLSFRGQPVDGRRGMHADFLSKGAGEFAKAVHYIGASQRETPLPSTGPVPYSEDYRLLVAQVARGSFSFRIKEASPQTVSAGEADCAEIAIQECQSILAASTGDDERLADVAGEIDPRALAQVRAFLQTVADNAGVCALEFRGHEFSFRDTAQVRRSEKRLGDSILEDEAVVYGQFTGFFPHRPRAQFRIDGVSSEFLNPEIGRAVTARVASSVADAIDINKMLNRDVIIGVRVRRIGAGRPRYAVGSVQPDVAQNYRGASTPCAAP